MSILWSILLFVVAGLCEIGGGVSGMAMAAGGKTDWLRDVGALILDALRGHSDLSNSGIRAGLCRLWRNFHCLVVTLGLGIRWAKPDRYDVIGGVICLAGVAVIMYTPRG